MRRFWHQKGPENGTLRTVALARPTPAHQGRPKAVSIINHHPRDPDSKLKPPSPFLGAPSRGPRNSNRPWMWFAQIVAYHIDRWGPMWWLHIEPANCCSVTDRDSPRPRIVLPISISKTVRTSTLSARREVRHTGDSLSRELRPKFRNDSAARVKLVSRLTIYPSIPPSFRPSVPPNRHLPRPYHRFTFSQDPCRTRDT